MLFDGSLCVGCRQCEAACSERWGLKYDEAIAAEEKLSERKLTAVVTAGESYLRRLCMHCSYPGCASVCPVKALEKTPLGPVTYDESRCIGCRYCMVACPYQVPVYEWSRRLPRVRKCDMCYERQKEGRPSACAEICPAGATICGERDELIAEARRRLAESPEQYHAHIYGVEELGGTSVLFIAPRPIEYLGGNPGLPEEPLPELTWRVLSLIPNIVTVVAVSMGGVWWITHRREEVAEAERREREGK
jgi:formate dehydrogenase iron-sulfur subunit